MKFKALDQSKAKLKNLAKNLNDARKMRVQLRKPTGFKMVIADAISLLDPSQWDDIVQGQSFFFQRDYLLMLESAGPENLDYRFVIICDGSEPVAALVLQIATINGQQIPSGKKSSLENAKKPKEILKKVLRPVKDKILSGLQERILICGNLLSYGFHGVAFAKNKEGDSAKIWPAIAEALYRVRNSDKLFGDTDFILIKDITQDYLESSRVLSKISYRELETEPNMNLEISPEWKTYEGYLASLQSKYRSAVKQQIFKPIEEAGCTVLHLTNLENHASRIHQLYLEVHENAALRLFTLPSEYFSSLEKVVGENFLCSIIKRGEKILGFIITIKDGQMGYGYHIGYDKKEAENLPLYLRLLHASVSDACELGISNLSLGRTALEPKARLGAKPEPISVWLRHRQPVMNIFVKNLLRVVPHDEAPERSPFKKG